MKQKPDPKTLKKLGGALRHWYFSIGVELEMVVEADYPRTAEDSIHDVIHQMLDPIDRHRFPRVTCNLVGNLTPWPQAVTIGALAKPVRETTFATLATSERTLKRRKSVLP